MAFNIRHADINDLDVISEYNVLMAQVNAFTSGSSSARCLCIDCVLQRNTGNRGPDAISGRCPARSERDIERPSEGDIFRYSGDWQALVLFSPNTSAGEHPSDIR